MKSILEKIALVLNIKSFDINIIKAKSLMIDGHFANFKDSYSLTVNNKDDLKDIYEKLYDNATYFFKRKKDKMMLSFLDVKEIEEILQGNLN